MPIRTLPRYRGPRCTCGAARNARHRTCRKCYAVLRWLRRRAPHRTDSGETPVAQSHSCAGKAVAR